MQHNIMQLVGYATQHNAIGWICNTQHTIIWENPMHILSYFIQLKYGTDVHTYLYDKNVNIIR